MNRRNLLVVNVAAVALFGCSALPGAGPRTRDIISGATVTDKTDPLTKFKYALIELSSRILDVLGEQEPGSLYSSFGTGRSGPPQTTVGVGDTVQVTIFESKSGGLFIPADAGSRPGNYVQLPGQTVDQKGYISVPFAGSILVKGRTLPQIQRSIENKLANKAIEPQAMVTLLAQTSAQVTVIGRVGTANKINLNYGDRVLDVLSRAGGVADAGYEVFVSLQRAGRKATIYFLNLVQDSKENIFVAPGDTFYVFQEQRSFTAFGASGASGQFKFEQEHLLLTDAVGKAGGLLDNRADPGQVLVYRNESRDILERLHIDISQFPTTATSIPTIYRANFRDPSSFFVASEFYVHDHDVIYVTNADQVELFKFLNLAMSVPDSVATVSGDLLATRNYSSALTR